MKPEAIIWGAGKIGRGFLAEIFNDAGYSLSFIEYDNRLIDALKTSGVYTIHKAMGEGMHQRMTIDGFKIYSSQNEDLIKQKLTNKDVIVGIAVHPGALSQVMRVLALGLMERAKVHPESTIDILLCVNMLNTALHCRELLKQYLPEDVHGYLKNNVGLVESVVMRICPQPTPEILKEDRLAILTNGYPVMPVDGLAFKGKVPQTNILHLSDNIKAEETRKIYTLNMAQTTLAYLGKPRGYEYAVQAINDKDIHYVVSRALDEAALGLSREFGFGTEEMKSWNNEIIQSLKNPIIKDTLERLGSDSRRKLGRNDRLVGPALLSRKHGAAIPLFLAQAIAYGFKFQQSKDPGTQAVQSFVKEHGIEQAIRTICGIHEKELILSIKKIYNKICHDPIIIRQVGEI
jgi:mannitol-1-phosphate 5-dehydrogenase